MDRFLKFCLCIIVGLFALSFFLIFLFIVLSIISFFLFNSDSSALPIFGSVIPSNFFIFFP